MHAGISCQLLIMVHSDHNIRHGHKYGIHTLVEILLKYSGHFLKECNKVSIASTYCSALARTEQLLRTTIIKVGGSHTTHSHNSGKERYCYLYQTFPGLHH